ncbi:MAG TPA: response regulator, partial [Planctomycetaceae bacterium]|nr:response regulator [Planctomycetaceae bacterium]
VDDESAIRELLSRALSQHGFRCDTAENGETALEMCARHQYDLIITDLKMPVMNGHIFCTQLMKQQDRKPEICVLTGIIQPLIDEDLRKRGIKHLYRKPVEYKEFAKNMLEILNRKKASRHKNLEPAQSDESTTPSGSKHNVVVLSTDSSFCHRIVLASAESPLDVIVALSTDHL